MKNFLVILGVVFVFSNNSTFAGDSAVFPCVSDPKSSALSFIIAATKGDVKTARAIYTGDEKEVLAMIETMASLSVAAEKFNKAITAKFGDNALLLLQTPAGLQMKMGFGNDQAPLFTYVALGTLNQEKDKATLSPDIGGRILLERIDQKWVVTSCSLPLAAEMNGIYKRLALFYSKIAEDIIHNKFNSVPEVLSAMEKLIAEGATKKTKD